MSDRPTFAVVIPTYNRATRLVNTLETVFGQEGQATEIIVVDNCSTDETPEVMSDLMDTHKNLGYYRHEVNLERAASRNTGMSKATADYVTFLDSDDLMYAQTFARQAISRSRQARSSSTTFTKAWTRTDDTCATGPCRVYGTSSARSPSATSSLV